MARAGYDFQSPDMKNAIGKEARAMSKEIIQFDQAMFETKLDATVRDKVEQIADAMLDEEADRIANAARYVFLVKLAFLFGGGDGMLDSLNGRSRRGEVFEGTV